MGIELRRVPPDWKHPADSDYRQRASELAYEAPPGSRWRPLFDEDWSQATRRWWAERIRYYGIRWLTYWPAVFGWIDLPDAIRWPRETDEDSPPQPFDYRPRWRRGWATAYQLYETVSEGTPISPVFPTIEALASWCAAQTRPVWVGVQGFNYEQWFRFLSGGGWAPSGLFTAGKGYRSGAAAIIEDAEGLGTAAQEETP